MTNELEAFKAELRAAGQPYSHWGGRVVGFGLAILIAAQVLASYALLLLALSLVVITAGWVMMIIAFVRRRRWARAHPLAQEPEAGGAP